jgi:hypothetical protein
MRMPSWPHAGASAGRRRAVWQSVPAHPAVPGQSTLHPLHTHPPVPFRPFAPFGPFGPVGRSVFSARRCRRRTRSEAPRFCKVAGSLGHSRQCAVAQGRCRALSSSSIVFSLVSSSIWAYYARFVPKCQALSGVPPQRSTTPVVPCSDMVERRTSRRGRFLTGPRSSRWKQRRAGQRHAPTQIDFDSSSLGLAVLAAAR